VKTGTALGLMAGLLQGCDLVGGGTVGPPPIPPEMMTEADARIVIRDVFAENGIELNEDVPLQFEIELGDSVAIRDVLVDGYSSELRTGFEYFSEDDDYDVRAASSAMTDTTQHGPIFVNEGVPEESEQFLEEQTQAFIDSLRAMGWI